tara:strand:- start:142 stop:366 length:225 start_codon:yes stop_codon:yes gene_type:complete
MNLIKEIKNLRDEMLSVNWPSQRLSNIITRYESENPPVIAKDDDRGPLDLTRLLEEKDREIAKLRKQLDSKSEV